MLLGGTHFGLVSQLAHLLLTGSTDVTLPPEGILFVFQHGLTSANRKVIRQVLIGVDT